MERQNIINQIISKFKELGLAYRTDDQADITAAAEFLDAGWSTGKKKITYEASIFVDEGLRTVFMWELTKEQGQGLSFGGGSETSFQSGTTLFRKVKSIQYGPEGKAYEYTLNLGEIPKTVKEAAKQYGYKFKTVLSKNKAQYPAGFVPIPRPDLDSNTDKLQAEQKQVLFCSNCGTQLSQEGKFCKKCGAPVDSSQQGPQSVTSPSDNTVIEQPYSNADAPFYSQAKKTTAKEKNRKSGLIGFIFLAIITLGFYALTGVSTLGWMLGIAVLVGLWLAYKKYAEKGCLVAIIIWIIAFVLLFFIMAFTITRETSDNQSDNSRHTADLPYSKTINLSDNLSTLNMTLNEQGKRYTITFEVKFDTKSLPTGFIHNDGLSNKTNKFGDPATDNLGMALFTQQDVSSAEEKYYISAVTFASGIDEYGANPPKPRPIVTLSTTMNNATPKRIKEVAQKYDKLMVFWYNDNEADISKDNKGYYSKMDKNAYSSHSPIVVAQIPWNEIMAELGIK